MNKKLRDIRFEWLRIVAMLMIIILHYLSKGGFLVDMTEKTMVPSGYMAWFLEAFCLVSVNVYVLISGYFGNTATFSIKKVVTLWLQVVGYSVIISIVAIGFGIIPIKDITLYQVINMVFPIVTEHYWFATAYMILMLLMPFLNLGIEQLEKKNLQWIILALLCYGSIMKSILPMHLPWDKLGFDALWFVVLYLTGAYLSKYKIEFFGKAEKISVKSRKIVALVFYIIGAFGIFLVACILRILYLKTGKLADFITYTYSYNHILTYISSIGLFCFVSCFKEKMVPVDSLIIKVSKATFGVYLLHEHLWIRYLWPKWLHAEQFHGKMYFIIPLIFSVGLVFVVGVTVELTRLWLKKIFKRHIGA